MIAGRPRVLIVDDDPVSLSFLTGALEGAGYAITAAATPAAALAAAGVSALDLLLIDRNLPGKDGPALLHELRARGIDAAAIAMSADMDPATQAQMLERGFAATLAKPAGIVAIHALVARLLGAPVIEEPGARTEDSLAGAAVLDDLGALAAIGGDVAALRALRRMLHVELLVLERELRDSDVTIAALQERLHRLRASCGFCGAPALAAGARRLERAVASPSTADPDLIAFLSTCRATIAALIAADASLIAPSRRSAEQLP